MSSQQELEDIIAWYAKPLGMEHYRIEVKWGENANPGIDTYGDAWISTNYPQIIVGVKPSNESDIWRNEVVEETAVHELVHVTIQPMKVAYLDLLNECDLPRKAYSALLQAFDRQLEHAVETLALALVAVAYADRGGPAPQVGGIIDLGEEAA